MRVLWLRVVLFVLVSALVAGQQTPFVHITGPNAPKGAAVLFEDSRGGLWMGGAEQVSEGLTYFDGSRFIPVSNFPKVLVTGISGDSNGGIWVGTAQGIYRLVRGRVDKGFSQMAVLALANLGDDVFVAEAVDETNPDGGAKLIRITAERGTWIARQMVGGASAGRFQVAPGGSILYLCGDGFCEITVRDIKQWKPKAPVKVTRHVFSISLRDGGTITRDRAGCLWRRSNGRTAYQCPGEASATLLPTEVASVSQPETLEFNDGSIALPSLGELAIGRPGRFRVITAARGYPSAAYSLITKDESLWVSNANGLFVYRPSLSLESWNERDGLDGTVWSVLPFESGVLAIAGDSVRILSPDRSRWGTITQLSNAVHLSSGPNRTFLVSSRTEGVIQIDRSGKIISRSGPATVLTLIRAPDGRIWTTQTGLSLLHFRDWQMDFQRLTTHFPRAGAGFDIKVDKSGGVESCFNEGLIRSNDGATRAISMTDGLLENPCNCLAIDQSGDIWYAYARIPAFSLIRHPPEATRSIEHYRDGAELGIAQTNFFDSDSRGWLWRGTEDGIYVADLDQARLGRWLHLDQTDGLPGTDANQRSFVEGKDGSVWFGAGTTISHLFPPADLVHPRYSPSVFVSGFSWNGGAFQMANVVSDIEHGADIVAHIGSLQFDRRNALRLRYRLLPEQTEWKPQRDLDVALGTLSWGSHTLEVQGRLYTGPWSSTVSKSFTVLSPVWLTLPFVLGYLVTGTLAGTGGYAWQRKVRQRAGTRLPALADWRMAVLSPDVASPHGTVLDERFEVGPIIARGGFATVYEGRDRRQGLPCAVKIFRHELLENSWMARRFQQEVSALQQIDHVNVVRIYGHGNTGTGAPYLAMEFVDGETLRDVLGGGLLDRGRVASYLRQTGSSLGEIHARRICHRDLKPENLMIRRTDEAGRDLVLIDFSIAIVQDPDETVHGLSRAAGTLQYMAPEQAIGYADASSDIYSLAKIFLEMLTGTRLSVLLPDASMDLPVRIREYLTGSGLGLSEGSIELVAGALEFDPARRPKDARAFAEAVCADLEATQQYSQD